MKEAPLSELSVESLVAAVTDEFMERVRQGDKPDVEEYAQRHPKIAPLLRQVLPTLLLLRADDSAATGGHVVSAGDEALGMLGDFHLLREVGRGGMGIVYEAEQVSLGRRVALKVLPFAATLDHKQLGRFKTEAQAAAHLHHTNIVPVYAVGTERGVHYYAMQFIQGRTVAALIHELAQLGKGVARQPDVTGPHIPIGGSTGPAAALSTENSASDPEFFRMAARLGVQAAEALEHAHSQGILHRDVKPANLLLDLQGNLWVTDFGLARVQSETGLTMTGDLVGTLRYMSPEQALAKRVLIDQRTDVYSLGATIYELLTLQPAFTGNDRQELLRQIAFEEPKAPRRINKRIPSELETITLKAIAKNPAERYTTAQELADDLRRFLDDKPIRARKPTLWQQVARLARRNKAAVVAGVVVLLVALVASAISNVLIWSEKERTKTAYASASEQRKLARQAVDDMFTRVAEEWLEDEPFLQETQREFVEKALAYYEKFAQDSGDDPEARHDVGKAHLRAGKIQRKLGEYAKAEAALDQAIAVLERLAEERPEEPAYRQSLADSCNERGNLAHVDLSRPAEAETFYQQARALREKLVRDHPDMPAYRKDLSRSYSNLANLQEQAGQPVQAERLYRKALDLVEALVEEFPREPEYRRLLSSTLSNLGTPLGQVGRLPEGEKATRQAIEHSQRLVKEYPRVALYRKLLAGQQDNLGISLHKAGRLDEAIKATEESVGLSRKLAEDFPNVPRYRAGFAAGQGNLARLLGRGPGRQKEADLLFSQARQTLEKLVAEYPRVPYFRMRLGHVRVQEGAIALYSENRLPEAEKSFQAAVSLYEGLARETPRLAQAQINLINGRAMLARVLAAQGRRPEADRESRQAVAAGEQGMRDFPEVPVIRARLASDLLFRASLLSTAAGRKERELLQERATRLLEALVEKCPGDPSYRYKLATALGDHAASLALAGRLPEAEQALRRAVALSQETLRQGPTDPEKRVNPVTAQMKLQAFLRAHGKPGSAEEAARQAVAFWEKLAADNPALGDFADPLAHFVNNLGQALSANGKLAEAEAAFRRALDLFGKLAEREPDEPRHADNLRVVRGNLANSLRRQGQLGQAVAQYRTSLEEAEKLAAKFPQTASHRVNLGATAGHLGDTLEEMGRPEEAEQAYRRALAVDQKLCEEAPANMAYLNNLGGSWLALGDYAAVGKVAEKLDFPPAASLLAVAECRAAFDAKLSPEERKKQVEACARQHRELAERWLKQAPKNATAHNGLAWHLAACLHEPFRDLAWAVEHAKKAVELAPTAGYYWNTLGVAHYRSGDLKAARQALEKALSLNRGGTATDFFFLAMIDWRLGEKAKANEWYAKGLESMKKNPLEHHQMRPWQVEAARLLGKE